MINRLASSLTAAAALLGLTAAGAHALPNETADGQLALDVLERIEVAEDYAGYEYSSEVRSTEYAPSGWVDHNGSGHHTRDDILIRDMDPETLGFRDEDGAVDYGEFIDPYTAEWTEHVLGQSDVDIEHVVAIGQAHRNGAWEWDEETKQDFYQDQDNLLAVSSSANSSKSDRDAADWRPTNQGVHCEFVASTVYVKDKWELSMNPAEHAQIESILTDSECQGQEAVPAVAMLDADYATDAPVTDDEATQEEEEQTAEPITEEEPVEDETEAVEAAEETAETVEEEEDEDSNLIGMLLIGAMVVFAGAAARAYQKGKKTSTRR